MYAVPVYTGPPVPVKPGVTKWASAAVGGQQKVVKTPQPPVSATKVVPQPRHRVEFPPVEHQQQQQQQEGEVRGQVPRPDRGTAANGPATIRKRANAKTQTRRELHQTLQLRQFKQQYWETLVKTNTVAARAKRDVFVAQLQAQQREFNQTTTAPEKVPSPNVQTDQPVSKDAMPPMSPNRPPLLPKEPAADGVTELKIVETLALLTSDMEDNPSRPSLRRVEMCFQCLQLLPTTSLTTSSPVVRTLLAWMEQEFAAAIYCPSRLTARWDDHNASLQPTTYFDVFTTYSKLEDEWSRERGELDMMLTRNGTELREVKAKLKQEESQTEALTDKSASLDKERQRTQARLRKQKANIEYLQGVIEDLTTSLQNSNERFYRLRDRGAREADVRELITQSNREIEQILTMPFHLSPSYPKTVFDDMDDDDQPSKSNYATVEVAEPSKAKDFIGLNLPPKAPAQQQGQDVPQPPRSAQPPEGDTAPPETSDHSLPPVQDTPEPAGDQWMEQEGTDPQLDPTLLWEHEEYDHHNAPPPPHDYDLLHQPEPEPMPTVVGTVAVADTKGSHNVTILASPNRGGNSEHGFWPSPIMAGAKVPPPPDPALRNRLLEYNQRNQASPNRNNPPRSHHKVPTTSSSSVVSRKY